MRRVTLGATGIETSALGFGAAGLGSRVGAAEGARALAEAFAGGVSWLDLAPVYGAGEAEAIAAPFLRAHRDEIQIATKAGLALGRGYAGGGGLRAALMPLARRAVGAIGPLRRAVRASGATGNAKLPLSAELLTASLEASLRRLGTDRVELFLLHGATPGEVARDDIRRALEDLLAAGKARAAGVAGVAAAAEAALAVGPPYAVVQTAAPDPAADPAADPLAQAAAAAGFGRITHSVFGVGATWETLRRRLAADPAAAALLAGEGGEAEAGLAAALLARALAANPDGTVLVSMLSARSRARNLAAAAGAGAGTPAGARAGAPAGVPAAAEAGLARLLAGR
jgi:aryl-alcohol dehydrogenase-like predicted oxidoreductase